MGTDDESVWLFKINPQVLEVLNQLLKAMEHLSMASPKEEPVQVPDRMPGTLLTVDEAAQRLRVSKLYLAGVGCLSSNILLMRSSRVRAMATMARFPPERIFILSYFSRIAPPK